MQWEENDIPYNFLLWAAHDLIQKGWAAAFFRLVFWSIFTSYASLDSGGRAARLDRVGTSPSHWPS